MQRYNDGISEHHFWWYYSIDGAQKILRPTQQDLRGPQINLRVYIAHSNRVWPSLDLKIEIWPSGTKRLPIPDIRYAPV